MGEGPVGLLVVEDGRADVPARPHALAEVANEAIARHALADLETAGVQEVIVASSAEHAEAVEVCLAPRGDRAGAQLTFLSPVGPMNLAAALAHAAPAVGDAPCIVHLADGLLGEPIGALIAGLRPDAPDAVVFVHQARSPRGRLSDATLGMLHLAELDSDRVALGMAGVSLFGPGALKSASRVEWGSAQAVDLIPLSHAIQLAGGNVDLLRADSWRRYSGGSAELLDLNRMALERLEPEATRSNGNDIEGRVRIDARAVVHASVIVGPAVIGPGACVTDAYIGPYTSVGAGARIEGAEIERSIIGTNASIMHVGGRIVASVIGSNARVFRDFSLPRALRLRVGDGTEVALW